MKVNEKIELELKTNDNFKKIKIKREYSNK